MFPRHIALVNESSDRLSARLLTKVSAALQKQVVRDFCPIWEVAATVNAFSNLEDVPLGYWPVVVLDDVQGAAGVHLDKDGQPYALVEMGDQWSLTASHETLEMLADPFGNRVIAGPSPKPGQGRLEFLVEVCDPSESGEYSYTVNGIRVSDFYTPSYFDPTCSPAARYSFSGAITSPRQVLSGGYLSWRHPPSDHWFQETYFGAKPEFRDLGVLAQTAGGLRASLRALVDAATPQGRHATRAVSPARLTELKSAHQENNQSALARATGLRRQIKALTAPVR